MLENCTFSFFFFLSPGLRSISRVMIFLGQQADSGSDGLSGLKLILQAGTAGFEYLCLPLQSSAERAHIQCGEPESWSKGWYFPISHRQSHSSHEPGCDFRKTPGGYICSCSPSPSIEHTLATKSSYALCDVLTCLLNKDFLARKVRDPSQVC